MGGVFARLVAEAIGVPDWAPRLIKRVALGIIVFTAVVVPTTFRHGVTLWVNQETHQIMQRMQPLLTGMTKTTEPSEGPTPSR